MHARFTRSVALRKAKVSAGIAVASSARRAAKASAAATCTSGIPSFSAIVSGPRSSFVAFGM